MGADNYMDAMSYEMLIRRAFNCPTGSKHGAHQQLMQNAITMEQGKTYAKHLGSFDKQFGEVKSNVEKALHKLVANKDMIQLAPFFNDQLQNLSGVETTTQLLIVVKDSLSKIPHAF